jgi:death-on-curing protein
MIRYLTAQEVIFLHDKALAATGGIQGIVNVGLLESAVENAKATFEGQDLFPDLESKCAATVFSLIHNHPFADGNKRTGAYVLLMMLELNERRLAALDAGVERVIMAVAGGAMTRDELDNWLRLVLTPALESETLKCER